ncbi:homogentisate phytyltransferase [Fragilariopsis cylindrus CCMP1102]|uniref:Homogentisate phytyltransferase n=1 Tax=Fragilariopsis cylindrus CCMP1102 TaxID=635003 RepID=A0A1E7F9X4_9STRA|nr:homogentisate phytyltransferase [Fragilariopsis cylindrus CCMP1102]|eukprot:OEU14971.1 homogentisate phytyltransferase [Fragilariopsis cylindrus CCMP1102]
MITIASAPSHIIYLFVLLVVGLMHNGSAFQTTTTCRGNFPIRRYNQANLMRKILSPSIQQSSSPVVSSCHRRGRLNTILSESVSSSSTSSSSSSSSINVTTNVDVDVDVEIDVEIDADADTPSTNVTTNFDIDNTNTKTTEGITTTATATTNNNNNNNKKSFMSVLWRFTRPHTIIGSALAIPALHMLAATTYRDAFTVKTVLSILYATIPALLMNLYITGVNQITDVEIDKINKPDLPIAAGDLSMKNATIIVLVSLLLSVVLGVSIPSLTTSGLTMALGVSAVLGTVYSLPPFRLKRFPVLAAFCIVAVRGGVINAGFFAHAKVAAFGGSGSILHYLLTDPRCYLSSLYFAVFGVVIALIKDVPDVKGDNLSNIRTVAVRLGPNSVFRGMHRLLTTLFWGVGIAFFRAAVITSSTSTSSSTMMVRLGRIIVGISALVAGASVQKEAAPVDPDNPTEVYGFYMHLWKLFYLSYFVLPIAR